MGLWHPHTLERGSNFSYTNADPTFLKLIKAWYESLTLVNRVCSQIQIFPSKIPNPWSKRFRSPDPGSASASKNVVFFYPKNCFQALENIIWVVHPGSRGQKGKGSRESKKAPDHGSATLSPSTVGKKGNLKEIGKEFCGFLDQHVCLGVQMNGISCVTSTLFLGGSRRHTGYQSLKFKEKILS